VKTASPPTSAAPGAGTQSAGDGGWSVPAWFAAALTCIGQHEEGGSNSAAGFYGFVYPPSQYLEPGPQIAAAYGDSWWDVPQAAQQSLAYALYTRFGWSPWTTAPGCGL